MGGWKLEVFKMAVYMSFPVGVFYYFNQPQFFEKWMMEKRNELFPPQDKKVKIVVDRTMEELDRRREEQMMKK